MGQEYSRAAAAEWCTILLFFMAHLAAAIIRILFSYCNKDGVDDFRLIFKARMKMSDGTKCQMSQREQIKAIVACTLDRPKFEILSICSNTETGHAKRRNE